MATRRNLEAAVARDPHGEGARALAPILAWYAAYKAVWRDDPQAPRLLASAQKWLFVMLVSALRVEDAVDPVVTDAPEEP